MMLSSLGMQGVREEVRLIEAGQRENLTGHESGVLEIGDTHLL